MARRITEECISCGACEQECPKEAIAAGDGPYVIDPELCNECVDRDSPGCLDVCPVADEAIVKA